MSAAWQQTIAAVILVVLWLLLMWFF